MPHLLRMSEAGSLAIHATAVLASAPDRLLTRSSMSAALGVSEAHLTKVLQRLAKVGIVHSLRGPSGGFSLARPAGLVSLLDVYEAIEGPITELNCLFMTKACRGDKCVLGGLLAAVNSQGRAYLSGTTLADIADAIGIDIKERSPRPRAT